MAKREALGWACCWTAIVLRKEKDGREEYSFCPGCDEKYEEPIKQDGIQGMKCQRWWHQQWSSFEGDLTFKCDIC